MTMRALPALLVLLLCGCGPGLIFNNSQEMTPDEMLQRAELVFVGVIESHQLESWPFFRVLPPGEDPAREKLWRILRRVVQVETILRGHETANRLDVYEIYWVGGTTGNWNATQNGERDLFLVRKENGKYHVVRDWWRSIFPVTAGPHRKLPLDESHPLWERIALMNYWMHSNESSARLAYPHFNYHDPGGALSMWRVAKLQRGLLRHPSPSIRIEACRDLIMLGGLGQNECWDDLSEAEQKILTDRGPFWCRAEEIKKMRHFIDGQDAATMWKTHRHYDGHRFLTAINNLRLRREFCRLWQREYPHDHDNGCPADSPPPATIVTEQGDVPLLGPWPRK